MSRGCRRRSRKELAEANICLEQEVRDLRTLLARYDPAGGWTNRWCGNWGEYHVGGWDVYPKEIDFALCPGPRYYVRPSAGKYFRYKVVDRKGVHVSTGFREAWEAENEADRMNRND